MRRSPFVLSLPLVAVMSAAGCGSGGSNYQANPAKPAAQATFQPGQELSMFPMAVGNQWTYTADSSSVVQGKGRGSASFEMTLKVTNVTPIANGNRATIAVTTTQEATAGAQAKSKTDQQVWDVTKSGIYQVSVGNPPVPFSPSQPNLLFPPDANRKFSWKGTGIAPAGGKGSMTIDSRILPMQQVDADKESYSAIPVESKGTFQIGNAKGQMASMAYWSPKVGLVRFRQELVGGNTFVVLTLKLKAKTVR